MADGKVYRRGEVHGTNPRINPADRTRVLQKKIRNLKRQLAAGRKGMNVRQTQKKLADYQNEIMIRTGGSHYATR